MTDMKGGDIGDGDIILHGEMYWEVIALSDSLWIVRGGEIEELQQYWCDCGRVVGSGGFLYEPN
jgi:hypothetical protein